MEKSHASVVSKLVGYPKKIVSESIKELEKGSESNPFKAAFLDKIEDDIMDFESQLQTLEKVLKSPIERYLASALIIENQNIIAFNVGGLCWGANRRLDTLLVSPQHEIAKFKVDFLLTYFRFISPGSEQKRSVVVECDGHDFHEKTKEQAAYDKARERQIQAIGYPILRFTGSEIFADPLKCAREINSYFKGVFRG